MKDPAGVKNRRICFVENRVKSVILYPGTSWDRAEAGLDDPLINYTRRLNGSGEYVFVFDEQAVSLYTLYREKKHVVNGNTAISEYDEAGIGIPLGNNEMVVYGNKYGRFLLGKIHVFSERVSESFLHEEYLLSARRHILDYYFVFDLDQNKLMYVKKQNDMDFCTVADGINIRTAPDKNAKISRKLERGETVHIIEYSSNIQDIREKNTDVPQYGSYVKISSEDNHTGWVFDLYLVPAE